MSHFLYRKSRRGPFDKGFTLIEVIVVIAIIGILAGISTPAFMEIAQNARYREASRNLTSALREARSLAVNTNRQHRVEIDSENRQVRLLGADMALVRQWEVAPTVSLDPPLTSFTFNPNGSVAQQGEISVLDLKGAIRFRVQAESSGRVRIY
jgi:general secretion pathway protein H